MIRRNGGKDGAVVEITKTTIREEL